LKKLYYIIRPIIPRWLQLAVRSRVVRYKRARVGHIWPIDYRADRAPAGWPGWPEGKKFALVLTHDVDTENGHDKCLKLMELEKKMGFKSSFYFVAKRYAVSGDLRKKLTDHGFGVGLHGLYHDGKKFFSYETFTARAKIINEYLKKWNSTGFSSPSMLRNLDWIHDLNIKYDLSTFDTDPFEPQPEGAGTIFPFMVKNSVNGSTYVELPYTLPQDSTLFVIMRERCIDIWKKKLDWVAENGGMALINVHPDYINFENRECEREEYPVRLYEEFLEYIRSEYAGQFWNALPIEVAEKCKESLETRDSASVNGAR